MELKDFLLIFVSGGGGALVYWLMEHVPFLANLQAEYKRYVSLALSALLPVPFWLAGVGLGYWDAPADWRAWIESIFAIAAGAILASQALHGRQQLRDV